MEQMRIGTSHASIDIRQHITILTQTQTVCYLYYFESTLFQANCIFFAHLLIKKRLCDNQPIIVMLPKQYKNKEGVKISTIVYTQTIDLVSELTP